ncbi:hypothetical protein AQUCO_01900203v1 [Aquilegia coerulea]|uniref:Uncharacterized protein n=1 Tax=Aquilegia coerulea TaxID=218851 RepID=A0A2G5DJC9_AQUCA|nr:hypothetical protein AQUCO_01900203v1 [Aquilegia coerulea]
MSGAWVAPSGFSNDRKKNKKTKHTAMTLKHKVVQPLLFARLSGCLCRLLSACTCCCIHAQPYCYVLTDNGCSNKTHRL